MSFILTPRRERKPFPEAIISQEQAELAAREAEVAQRVKRDLAKFRAAAESQGQAEGFAKGFEAGQAEAAASLAAAAAALTAATADLATPLARRQAELTELVIAHAFALASHIIGCEVARDHHAIAQLTTQLLAQAEAERGPRQAIILRLNPEDLAALAPLNLLAGCNALADEQIAKGGARLDIIDEPSLQTITSWDATLPARIAAIAAAIA